jgi:hypothetical protein
MANSDYIPGTDADFLTWGTVFSNYISTNAPALGLTVPADVMPITTAMMGFQGALSAHLLAQQAAGGAKETKNTARSSAELAIRALVRRLQASPAVTDTQRAAMGITVRDKIRSMSMAEGGLTRPVGVVDTSQRLRHEIAFTDEASPTSRARPAGTIGCEIWVAVLAAGAAAPGEPGQLTFLGLDTATPYLTEFPGADAGKTAHYMLRWVKTNGEKGPWSETVSATIVG